MRKIIMLLVCFATSAAASDIIQLKNGMTFSHLEHQSDKVGKCFVCHDNVAVSKDEASVVTSQPGKIIGFGKEWAHKNCTECHDLYSAGPVTCNECHRAKVSGALY